MKNVCVECLDCGSDHTSLERIAQVMGVVSRVIVCACGSRFETMEQVIRRLPSRATRGITSQQMAALTELWGDKCLACSATTNLTWDHVIARDRAGAHTINNLQRLCARCNSTKSTKTVDYRSDEQKAWAHRTSNVLAAPGQIAPRIPFLGLGGKGGLPDLKMVREMDREVKSVVEPDYQPPERARVDGAGRGGAKKYPPEFELVLAACDGWRGHKGAAARAWVKNGQPSASVVGPVYAKWRQSDQWQRGFVPHLSTWLNAQGWEKEPNAEEMAGPRPDPRQGPIAPPEARREDFRRQAALAARVRRVKDEMGGERRLPSPRSPVADTIRELADGKAVG